MSDEMQWAISVGISAGGFVLALLALNWRFMKLITDGDATNATAIVAGNAKTAKDVSEKVQNLHVKIDNIKDTYVRRDDLAGHISHLEKAVTGMVDEQRRTNGRIDQILAAVIKEK